MDDPDDFLRSLELEQAEVYLAHLEIKIDWEVAAVQAAEILGRNGVEIASNIVTNYEQISTDKSADLQDYSTAYRFSQLTSCIFIKSHLDEDVESNDVAEYESDLIYALMSGSPILDKELRAWLAAFEEVFGVSSLPNKPENNNELRAILLACLLYTSPSPRD